ncbi:MAG: energy transducer TonB [Terriglobales bacterium]
MSPVALLFSSDEETSHRVVQALGELELEIAPCPDVFTAIEWLTSRSFDLVVADWDSGPEAAFLLKNARDLKLNKAAFTLALTSGKSNLADEEDNPDLILTKPLIPDQVKYAVLSNDRFLGCMKAWVARGDFAQLQPATPYVIDGNTIEHRQPPAEQPSPISPATRAGQSSPTLVHSRNETSPHLTFATLDRDLFRPMGQHNRGAAGSRQVKRYSRNRFLWGSLLTVAFVSVGYIFGQPLRVQSVFASVATAYKQALETTTRKLHSSNSDTDAGASALAQVAGSQHSGSGRSKVRGIPALPALLPDELPEAPAETLQADLDQNRLATTGSQIQIPGSLKTPLPEPTELQPVSLLRSPSLLSQVEPVNLPEDLSRALLLQKVTPSYPEQALKAGLQGAVVLQAWIGKDGSIRDLKLMDGSLLLGQAAVKAVKQWRYKPYLRNGVAVEAQTYVTVNFRLP